MFHFKKDAHLRLAACAQLVSTTKVWRSTEAVGQKKLSKVKDFVSSQKKKAVKNKFDLPAFSVTLLLGLRSSDLTTFSDSLLYHEKINTKLFKLLISLAV